MIAKLDIDEFEEALELLPNKATLEEIKEMALFRCIVLSLKPAVFLENQIVDKTLMMAALITILH